MSTTNEQNIKDKITDNIKKNIKEYLEALKKAAALEQKNIGMQNTLTSHKKEIQSS